MSEEKKETRSRPRKGSRSEGVGVDEMLRCYSDSFRMWVLCEEMKRFLHSRGKKSVELGEACSDTEVLCPFVASRLFQRDTSVITRQWLEAEDWDKLKRWIKLCEVWDARWAGHRAGDEKESATAAWRLGCVMEAWRLLDEYWIERPEGYLIPPAGVITQAGLEWVREMGACLLPTDNVMKNYARELERMGLEWMRRSPLMRGEELEPLMEGKELAEGEELRITLKMTRAEMDDLERRIRDYDAENDDTAERELDYLRNLDW
jgi:hypothetical protein